MSSTSNKTYIIRTTPGTGYIAKTKLPEYVLKDYNVMKLISKEMPPRKATIFTNKKTGKKVMVPRRQIVILMQDNTNYKFMGSGTPTLFKNADPSLYFVTEKLAEYVTSHMHDTLKLNLDRSYVKEGTVVVNLYEDGNDSISYHADDEKTIDKHAPIYTVSFGCTRKFYVRHNTQKTGSRYKRWDFLLKNRDVIAMVDIQTYTKHCIPKELNKGPRISFTFRLSKKPLKK